jgi:hypothetical protein
MVSDPNNPKSFSARSRARRAAVFASLLEGVWERRGGGHGLSILDVGGTLSYWEMNLRHFPSHLISRIEVVNLPPSMDGESEINGVKIVRYAGDALRVESLREPRYDVVHSNSVIEHVGNLRAQMVFADNIRTLSDNYYVQTPCRLFPIEPHFYFPFFAQLPLSIRGLLHRNFHLGFMGTERDWLKSRIHCDDVRLLTKKELSHLFPEGRCIPEMAFCMVKSWIITNIGHSG